MTIKPKVSIIIPFVSLNSYIIESIEHCFALDYPNYNLILLPDGEIKLSPHLFNSSKLKIIETGNVTIAKKRNMGIKASTDAQYYAFIDSDAYPHKEWLKNAIQYFEELEDLGAVGGPNLSPINDDFRKQCVSNALKSIIVSGICAMTFRERGKDKFCTDLPTCNLIVKKNILDILGYFNESYITGEDKEFCNRLMRNNIKIFFSQKVIIYHHRRSLFLPFITQRLVYGLSILKIIKDNLTIPNLCLFLPAFFIFLISFLFIFSIFNHHVFFIILLISLLYLLLIAFESLRWASNLFDIPYTFLAIIIGNFVPGIGTFLALVNTGTIIRKKYRNY